MFLEYNFLRKLQHNLSTVMKPYEYTSLCKNKSKYCYVLFCSTRHGITNKVIVDLKTSQRNISFFNLYSYRKCF